MHCVLVLIYLIAEHPIIT